MLGRSGYSAAYRASPGAAADGERSRRSMRQDDVHPNEQPDDDGKQQHEAARPQAGELVQRPEGDREEKSAKAADHADSLFGGHFPHDVSMVNWPGNDYRDAASSSARPALSPRPCRTPSGSASASCTGCRPKRRPRATGGARPELRLRADVMGTGGRLVQVPYIREARRILAVKTIVEQELSTACQPGPRAAPFADSCGIGWYPIDIHRSGPDDVGASCRTRPFQIPLGALLPRRIENLLAAAKNIGTTHITNGCYRLHPVEWNIGEAAGALAAAALDQDVIPRRIHAEPTRLARFQREPSRRRRAARLDRRCRRGSSGFRGRPAPLSASWCGRRSRSRLPAG